MKQPSKPRHESLDFYDIVKDSMHRDAQGVMVAWDSPRLSYDGRDIQDTFKSATKHTELPRLSLDSREGSIKSFKEGTKSRNLLKGPEKGYGGSSTMLKQLQEPETSKRPSSVVAKLMGLESFPESTQTCDTPQGISSCTTNKNETFAGSRISDDYKQHQSSVSPRTSKGSTLLQSRRDASITNVTLYSRFSLEPTPWRQTDTSQGSQSQASQRNESSTRASNPSLSVYGEIEKRMADLEFKKSGKDLRALKQILEAMQRYKESLDITRDQASNSPSDSTLSESSKVQSPRIRQKDPTSATVEMSNSTQGPSKFCPGSPTNRILVDKLDRQTAKDSPAMRHVKDPISQPYHSVDKSNKMRTSKRMQSSKVPQVINGENSTNSSNIAETRSPRLQKKFGLERRSPPTSPSSDSSSNRRQHNRQSMELSSPIDSMRSIDSHSDIEAIHIDHSEKINSNSIQLKGQNQTKAEKELSKESFMAETIVTAEQPSPVSVLDAAFYREDPPSPVKRKSDISRDLDEAPNTYDINEESSEDLPLSSNTTESNFSNGTRDVDLKTHKILLASGLLTGPSSSQAFHSSGYLINPMLFLALEQIRTNKMHFNIEHSAMKIAEMNNPEQMQRKLIFDVVNDVLVQKLILESSSTLWYQPNQPAGRKLEGQQLLDELCTEIDKLQHKNRNVSLVNEDENLESLLWEDLMQHPTICTEYYSEIPNIVLDIERLIFKDLITEVVRGEVANHSGKHCRKLQFTSRTSR
ncbi:DUF3741-associated sequence motif [Sesbania bispinosa]|nr:DUF3741-associated sequence motif [Sesbania bispinosa]